MCQFRCLVYRTFLLPIRWWKNRTLHSIRYTQEYQPSYRMIPNGLPPSEGRYRVSQDRRLKQTFSDIALCYENSIRLLTLSCITLANKEAIFPPPASSGERPTNAAKVPNITLASSDSKFSLHHERIDCRCSRYSSASE